MAQLSPTCLSFSLCWPVSYNIVTDYARTVQGSTNIGNTIGTLETTVQPKIKHYFISDSFHAVDNLALNSQAYY